MSVVLSGELRRTQSAVTHPVGEERKRPLCFAPQSRTRRMKSAPDSRLPHAPTCSQTKINAGRRRWTPSTRPFRAAMARRWPRPGSYASWMSAPSCCSVGLSGLTRCAL